MKISVLFVSESMWMEGVVYDLHVMAEGLARLGRTVYAIDPGRPANEPNQILPASRVFPDTSIELLSPRFRRGSLRQRLSARVPALDGLELFLGRYRAIDQFLASHPVDVIVLYSAVRSGIQTVRLARKYGVPVVFRNVDKLYNLWPTARQRGLARLAEKFVYARVNRVLALTPKYAEYLVDFGAVRQKVDLLVFPVDTRLFSPAVDGAAVRERWGLAQSDPVIVFIGTLYEFGGLVEFTRKFRRLLSEVPDAKLLIVGDGPVRPQLEASVADLGLEGRVIITGYQSFSEMPQYVAASTICLNAFSINETTRDIFSAKIIQYLAGGRATVSSALPGITTLLDSERTGVVYAESMDALIDEAAALLRQPNRRNQLAKKGREYVETHHSNDEVILALDGQLREVISRWETDGAESSTSVAPGMPGDPPPRS